MLPRARFTRRLASLAIALAALTLGSAGCASSKGFKIKDAPSGFAEVEAWSQHARYKAGDDVGLRIDALPNVKGGTLEYWAEDLVEKLAERGYTLKAQSAVRSKNDREGTRFDFSYRSPTSGEDKFFTTILFTTDEWRVIVQLAGDASVASNLDGRIQDALSLLKVYGCKIGKPVCKAPQPASLLGKYTAAVLPSVLDSDTPVAPPDGATEG
jgi:hypothetical protein